MLRNRFRSESAQLGQFCERTRTSTALIEPEFSQFASSTNGTLPELVIVEVLWLCSQLGVFHVVVGIFKQSLKNGKHRVSKNSSF